MMKSYQIVNSLIFNLGLLLFKRIFFVGFVDHDIQSIEFQSRCFQSFSLNEWDNVKDWINLYQVKNWTFHALQVGANDGNSDDFQKLLQKKETKFKALLIEPVPTQFSKLKYPQIKLRYLTFFSLSKTFHGRNDVTTLQALISESDEKVPFYYVNPLYHPGIHWMHEMASMDYEMISHGIPPA